MTDQPGLTVRVVDFETTGLPPKPCAVCEAAYVDLVSRTGNVWSRGAVWSSLVNPQAPIDVEAMAVHHITDEMVADAPTWDAVARRLTERDDYPADTLITIFAAHHAAFERALFDPPGAMWVDTYKNAVTLWPDAPSFKNQVLRYWLGLKLVSYLENHPVLPHRALGDAYVSAGILRRQFIEGLTLPDMVTIAANPVVLPRFHFGEHAGKPLPDVPTSYLEWIVKKSKGPWDPDVLHTAMHHLTARLAAQMARSPVDPAAVAAAQSSAERG
jgi:exodeoxyribonuclease X